MLGPAGAGPACLVAGGGRRARDGGAHGTPAEACPVKGFAPYPRRRRLAGCAAAIAVTISHDKLGRPALIRGLRIPVSAVFGQLGAGRTVDEVLVDFPDLEREDVFAALRYAAAAVQERALPLAAGR